jgi:hypothetical protein
LLLDAQRRRRERKNERLDHLHLAKKFTVLSARGAHSRASDAPTRTLQAVRGQ